MEGKPIPLSDRFADHLQTADPGKLESAVRTYVWLAEFGPEVMRNLYRRERDAVLKECERRGLTTVVERIRHDFAASAGNAAMRAV